jgi:hypothetical protein
MDWFHALQVAGLIITSVVTASGAVALAVKFGAQHLASVLLERERARHAGALEDRRAGYQRELEGLKASYQAQLELLRQRIQADLTFRQHVVHSHLDIEIEAIRSIWKALADLRGALADVHASLGDGSGKDLETLESAFTRFQEALQQQSPFIPALIYAECERLIPVVRQYHVEEPGEKRFHEFCDGCRNVVERIRDRLFEQADLSLKDRNDAIVEVLPRNG